MHGGVIFINADMVPGKEFCIDYHHIKPKTPSDLLAIILSTWLGETELLPAPFPCVHLDSLNINSESVSLFFLFHPQICVFWLVALDVHW